MSNSEPVAVVSLPRPGFALPAVLAVTGMVTLIFIVAMTALQSLNAEAASARSRVRFMQRALTVEANLSYMLTTEPFSSRGLLIGAPRTQDPMQAFLEGEEPEASRPTGEVRLDGRPYLVEADGAMLVRLQDQAGLVNLAYLTPEQGDRLLARVGADPAFARVMRQRVADYVDADALSRPGGAEAEDYPAGAAPPNRQFVRPDEWLSVLGARDAVDPRRWRDLRDSLVVDHTLDRMNVNTASAAAMEVLFGVRPDQARIAVERRETAPYLSYEAFASIAGAADQGRPDAVYTFPGGKVVLILRDGVSPWIYRARVSLTPSGLERPLWIDQTDMLEAPRRQAADTRNVPRLPYAPR
ncbi:general secretion pathway protein GspK [Brevundimonas sp. VNH65]|uniref:general secretion pathway protein GspK n=1 Tax=Brevundimonas sp. VNH65 TaxID=3400917 RepID=UPI003C0E349E